MKREPEGFAAARIRLRSDIHNLNHWHAPMRRDARNDLRHAYTNYFVEWCREKGVPWPKMAGKAIAVATVSVPVSIVVWIILVMT